MRLYPCQIAYMLKPIVPRHQRGGEFVRFAPFFLPESYFCLSRLILHFSGSTMIYRDCIVVIKALLIELDTLDIQPVRNLKFFPRDSYFSTKY